MTDDILTRAARAPDAEVRYGGGEPSVADVYLPSSRSAGDLGLVILIHGGFWRSRYDRMHLRPLAAALAESGFAVALPEYRRIGDVGGGYPGAFDDIERAVAELPGIIDGLLLEPGATVPPGASAELSAALLTFPGAAGDSARRVALVGHSAGGQLAIWSQTRPSHGPAVDLVVSLAGVLDLAAAQRLGLSGGVVGELLDDSRPGFEARLAEVDPMRLPVPGVLATAAPGGGPGHPSPRSPGPNIVLLHGTDDAEVPVEFSRAYARRDPGIRYREFAGVGHYELIDPASVVYPVLIETLGYCSGRRVPN